MTHMAYSDDDEFAEQKPQRKPRGVKAKSSTPKRRASAGRSVFGQACTIAFWGALLAVGITVFSLYRLGHAPSWRSLAIIALHGGSMLPGLFCTWLAGRWADRRIAALWLAVLVMMLLTFMAMAVFPALGFNVTMRFMPHDDELEQPQTLIDYAWNSAGMSYLYLTSGLRFWWPLAPLLPLYMGFMHWRLRR